MNSSKTLKSLLETHYIVPGEDDSAAVSIARNLVSGCLTENFKHPRSGGFEINIPEDYKISYLVAPEIEIEAEEYYVVPYNCSMWRALEKAEAEMAIREAIAEVPGSTDQDKLNFLARCICCERHSLNRPESLNDEHMCLPICGSCPGYSDCKCSCRHTARWIVREFNKIK